MPEASSTHQPGRGQDAPDGYVWQDAQPTPAHAYLWPAVEGILARTHPDRSRVVFDLGCGNGATMRWLEGLGYRALGVDPSAEGVAQAHAAYPGLAVERGSTDEDLSARFGRFATVLSLEVVEHVYAPRRYAAALADLLEPGGVAIVSTPYHGYLKNLALALSGRLDSHFTALWDHGHIKFWSVDTLSTLMAEVGLARTEVRRVGRIPALAKSMILTFRKRGGPT